VRPRSQEAARIKKKGRAAGRRLRVRFVKVPWPHARCVLCLHEPNPDDKQTALTEAHVIPKSVGGRLSAEFLCDGCNSRLGYSIEDGLLSDPSVRFSIEQIAAQLSKGVLDDMRKRQRWFTTIEGEQVFAAMDAKGELVPLESPNLLKNENVRALLERKWRKAGMSEEGIHAHLGALDEAQPGDTLELPGFTVRPRLDFEPYDFELPFDEPPVSALFPLDIAYFYVALFGEDKIYKTPQLQPIRDALLNDDASASAHWHIDSYRDGRGGAPEHRLAIRETGPPLIVHIQLFQSLVWQISFSGVAFTKMPPRYGINIATGEEFTW
jgi:hypothetical protein